MILTIADLQRYRRLKYAAPGKDPPVSEQDPGAEKTAHPPELPPEVIQRNRELLALIEEFIRTLPDEYTRTVVLLKYDKNLKWFEIAQRFGGTTGEALKQYVYAQLRKFNESMKDG
jgi:DNA-directed RNA polymerase specialized sigma24 family protein